MELIKRGSTGEKVKAIQRLIGGLVVDGVYGVKTEAAVKEWQHAHGLVADGIVGEKTFAAMFPATSKAVDPSVIYSPLKCCITKSANRTIKYIAIHYTAGASSAAGRALNMKNSWERTKKASADFGVDDRDMVQFNPDPRNYYCWAVGDTKAAHVNCPDAGNRNTISIEICSNLLKGTSASKPNHDGWFFTASALDNAVKLTKILMAKYGIPVDRVIRHYDVSGKLCPGVLGWNDGVLYKKDGTKTTAKNDSHKWEEFKKRLA